MESKSNNKAELETHSYSRRKRLLESLQKTIWWSGSLIVDPKKTL